MINATRAVTCCKIASPNHVCGYLIRRDVCVAARLHLQSKLAMSPQSHDAKTSRRQDAGPHHAADAACPCGLLNRHTSVPIPKFASLCRSLVCELRNRRTLATY